MLSIFPESANSNVDVVFFITVGVIIAAMVALYFIIPLLNRKKYKQQREALKKREEIFLANQEAKKNSVEQQN